VIKPLCYAYAVLGISVVTDFIEIELEFNQSEERRLILSLVSFALIGRNPIQSQSRV